MNVGLSLYPNSLEIQKKLTETLWGIVGGVLKVTPKIGILGPGPIFPGPPKGSKYKNWSWYELQPYFVTQIC